MFHFYTRINFEDEDKIDTLAKSSRINLLKSSTEQDRASNLTLNLDKAYSTVQDWCCTGSSGWVSPERGFF